MTPKRLSKRAETATNLGLQGSEGDQNRTILVKEIVELVEMDSYTEKIQREVEVLSAIKACKRSPS